MASASRMLAPLIPVSVEFPGHDGVLTISGDFAVRLGGVPLPTRALADFEHRMAAPFDVAPEEAFALDPITLAAPYAATDLRTLKAWRVTEGLVPTTTSANGLYAVRDSLAEFRKPRAFRPSALSTMLVLRIDGKDESPPLSVGGGGVAAALWRAMPQ